MITLTVNGQPRELPEPMTVTRLLEHIAAAHLFIAVARNGDVLHKDEYDRVTVQNGDTLEIVRMVGGGADVRNKERGTGNEVRRHVPTFLVPCSSFLAGRAWRGE